MPTRPPMRCSALDCDELATNRGRCAEHQRKRKSGAHRVIPGDERNTSRWSRYVTSYLSLHPKCQTCGARSTDVDHITEIADGGAMWDGGNHMPLCHSCHLTKTKHAARRRLTKRAANRSSPEPSLVERLWAEANK